MDIRFLFLIVFAFIFEIFFLSKDLRFKDSKTSFSNIDIEFVDSKTYTINKNRISTILVCDKIQQTKGKKLFFKPIATLYDTNITKTIMSDNAVLDDKTEIIKLDNNVKILYLFKKLTTNMLIYDLKKSIITDSKHFTLVSNNINATGNHLYFDTKNNIIKAKDIKYKFNIKE